MVNTSVRPNWK